MKNTRIIPRALLIAAAGYAVYAAVKKRNQQPRITDLDYGDQITYVIGHRSPDADSVGSSIAYAKLLNELGIKAKPVIAGTINNETRFFMEKYELPFPEVMEEADGKQFVLVDHATYLQAIKGMKDAKVISIIDHHKECDINRNEVPFIKMTSAGSSASLIYQMFNEYDAAIDKDTARILLMAILSDTKNLRKKDTNYLDRSAYRNLLKIAEIENPDSLYEQMEASSMNYDGMSDSQILHSDLKMYEMDGTRYCVATAVGKDHEEMIKLVDRMTDAAKKEFSDLDLDYVFVKARDNESNCMYMTATGDGAAELLNDIYFNYDGERYFIFDVSLSRKQHLVPMIDLAIKERKN
ncbi:MAG: DHH family phosphoesterase [Erysipelotrichaceae bacterium]|nr:DHH family phosphoesterase [Erysipelotrichaceae bacterium]